MKIRSLILSLLIAFTLSSCVSTVVGTVVDTTIEVVKIPFKIGGAVIDIATPDKEKSDFTESNQLSPSSNEYKDR